MSKSLISSLPILLIGLSIWLVRSQERSFVDSDRTSEIQLSRKRVPPKRPQITIDALESGQRLDSARFGWEDETAAPETLLGRERSARPLGGRAAAAPDWLSIQQAKAEPRKLKDIPGFTEATPPDDGLEKAISPESGYQITADEVTKLDMTSQKVVFNKNVRLTSPQFFLTSNQLVVYLGKDHSTMKLVEAHGDVNVRLTAVPPEKAYRGQSQDAVFDPKKDALTLTGWPKVKGASQEQVAAEEGTKMTLFTKTGRLFTEGRAQTRVTKSFMDESTGTTSKVPH